MQKIIFSKMEALGNDFVVIDAVRQKISLTPKVVRRLSERHFGIGCDQVLVAAPDKSGRADFHYRIFNADGREIFQCGNGARCLALFLVKQGLTRKKKIKVVMGPIRNPAKQNVMTLQIMANNEVMVTMGAPLFKQNYLGSVKVPKIGAINFGAVSLGNPHAVIQVPDVAKAEVADVGAFLNTQKKLFSQGVNVGFMQIINSHHIKLRVYERGVGETLACGSAAAAAVAIGRKLDLLDTEVKVEFTRGALTVFWGDLTKPLLLKGSANLVFHGEILV